ncbi:MAG: hypothetical protein LV481_03915 [Methylacidiphilales bacterium]|nr:hypothetical protein [Candidatus Methylacidiphilales bacterium]
MLNSAPVSSRRIAILNANWRVQSSICYMASCLEKEGYYVDIFLYAADESFCDDLLKDSVMIKIHRLGGATPIDSGMSYEQCNATTKKVWHLARMFLPAWSRRGILDALKYLLIKLFPKSGLVPRAMQRKVIAMARQNPYSALIGVEKGGLFWAGEVAKQTNIPLVYYSLELFTRSHAATKFDARFRRLKPLEERNHRKCALTIVQDVERGAILLSDNRVRRPMRMAYLPVSIAGGVSSDKSQWLQNELGLAPETVIILYFGHIWESRFCGKLAEAAQLFPENWRLVFHGRGIPLEITKIRQIDRLKKTRMSLRLVPDREREAVVRSAHVGLAFYDNNSLNDKLTGFASEKIAMYFKCGIPLISFRYPSYEHIEYEKAGVLVDHIEEISAAVEKILSDYDSYAQGAYACYKKHYCFETNFSRVLTNLRAIQQT